MKPPLEVFGVALGTAVVALPILSAATLDVIPMNVGVPLALAVLVAGTTVGSAVVWSMLLGPKGTDLATDANRPDPYERPSPATAPRQARGV